MCFAFLNLNSHFFIFHAFRQAFLPSLEKTAFGSLKMSLSEEWNVTGLPTSASVYFGKVIFTAFQTALTYKMWGLIGESYFRFTQQGWGQAVRVKNSRMMANVDINLFLGYSEPSQHTAMVQFFLLSGEWHPWLGLKLRSFTRKDMYFFRYFATPKLHVDI